MTFDILFFKDAAEATQQEAGTLMDDLRLDVLLDAMAGEDKRMADACKRVLLRPLTNEKALSARRNVRADVAAHESLFSGLMTAAREAVDGAARYAEFQKPRYDHIIPPQKKFLTEIHIARLYLKCLRNIHAMVTGEAGAFRSEAVQSLMAMIRTRFSTENIARMEARLKTLDSLRLSDDLTLSASVGQGLKPAGVVLNCLAEPGASRRKHLRDNETQIRLSSTTLIRNTDDVVQSAVFPLLQTMAHSNKSIRMFLEALDVQLGFYLGCAHLRDRLKKLGILLCEPEITPGANGIESNALQNAVLALQEGRAPAGNDVCFLDKRLVLVTGVNQGGKTTFLRSVGLAQLMAQCGMFVAAAAYACPLYVGLYTHFPSGEDTSRGKGLLDVELHKLSGIVDRIRPHSLLLMNETFQTTMPLDAKYLAELTVRAFLDSGITVLFVTHLYAYAAARYADHRGDTLFLRAKRDADGRNTYVLQEGEPYASAMGSALYREVIGG
ncbi:MAG: hypothetical protein JW811_01450 [Clostridiales bacterium]|nr:hypothetical protein [Clostridiales bacterium]